MSTILAALGGLGLAFGKLGANSRRSGEIVVTGPGASTGAPMGLLLTLTQA